MIIALFVIGALLALWIAASILALVISAIVILILAIVRSAKKKKARLAENTH